MIVRTAAEGASAEDIERDLVFLQRLWKTIEARAKESKAPALVYQEAELPLRVTRDLFTGDFERALVDHDRTLQADRRLPEEDLAAHGRARRSATRRRAPLFEASGVDAGDPLDAQPPRRPALGRLPDLRLRRGVHGHRRQHRPLRRLALEDVGRAARGHDHEEQPRGGEGGRPPAAAARHRRDHRHRLHRHGEPEEPRARSRRRCARSSSATGRRPTSSRSRRSASSR